MIKTLEKIPINADIVLIIDIGKRKRKHTLINYYLYIYDEEGNNDFKADVFKLTANNINLFLEDLFSFIDEYVLETDNPSGYDYTIQNFFGVFYMQKGIRQYQKNNYQIALNEFKIADKYLADTGNDRDTLNYYYGMTYFKQGILFFNEKKFELALESLKNAKKYIDLDIIDNYLGKIYLHKGIQNYHQGNKTQALNNLRKADTYIDELSSDKKRLNKYSSIIHFEFGMEYHFNDKFQKSINHIDTASLYINYITKDSLNYYLGLSYFGLNQYEKAEDILLKVIDKPFDYLAIYIQFCDLKSKPAEWFLSSDKRLLGWWKTFSEKNGDFQFVKKIKAKTKDKPDILLRELNYLFKKNSLKLVGDEISIKSLKIIKNLTRIEKLTICSGINSSDGFDFLVNLKSIKCECNTSSSHNTDKVCKSINNLIQYRNKSK